MSSNKKHNTNWNASIDKLLFSMDLSIPEYQRPYKWTQKCINSSMIFTA
jgi:uncharacterized protein with ParB-like and HNH nuclease domain